MLLLIRASVCHESPHFGKPALQRSSRNMRGLGKLFILILNGNLTNITAFSSYDLVSSQKNKKKTSQSVTVGTVSTSFTVDKSAADKWQFPQSFDYDSDRRVIVASTRGQHQCSKVPIPELEVIDCNLVSKRDRNLELFLLL